MSRISDALTIGFMFMLGNSAHAQAYGTDVPNRPQKLGLLVSFDQNCLLAVFNEPSLWETKEYFLRKGESTWRELDMAEAMQEIPQTARLLGHGVGHHSAWICLADTGGDSKTANRLLQISSQGDISIRPSIPHVSPLGGNLDALFENQNLGIVAVVRSRVESDEDLESHLSKAEVFHLKGNSWSRLTAPTKLESIDSVVGGSDYIHAAMITEIGDQKRVALYSGSELADARKLYDCPVAKSADEISLIPTSSASLAAFEVREAETRSFYLVDFASDSIRRIDDVPGCTIASLSVSDSTCLVVFSTTDCLGFRAYTLDLRQGLLEAKLVEILSKSVSVDSSHELDWVNGLFHDGMPVIHWEWTVSGI